MIDVNLGAPDYKRMFEMAVEERDCAIAHNIALGEELVIAKADLTRALWGKNHWRTRARGRNYVK